MSEVNCKRWKLESTLRASACAKVVLPTPGTSSISKCPRASRQASDSRNTSGFPRMASPKTDSISTSFESGTGGVYKESRTDTHDIEKRFHPPTPDSYPAPGTGSVRAGER